MSIVSFDEIHNGRGGGKSADGDGKMSTNHIRVFRATTNDASDDETDIDGHASCPNIGDPHPNDATAYCKSLDFKNEAFSKKVWIVTATYSAEFEYQEDPRNEAARITWRSEQYQKPAVKDKDGKGIGNSAGDPYDPPPEMDDSRWVATIVKNLGAVPIWLLNYQDAVNIGPFVIDGLTIGTRQAKVQSIEIGDWQYAGAVAYRVVTISMTCARSNANGGNGGFDLEILDAGFNRIKEGDATARQKILLTDEDDNKVEPSSPVPLDGSGAPLTNPGPSNAVFRFHRVYNELNFALLPLV